MIEIDEKTVGIWLLSLDPFTDWLGALREEDSGYRLTYRLRFYDPRDPDNDPFSGKDVKKWYQMKTELPRGEALMKVQGVVLDLERRSGNKAHEVLMSERGVKGFLDEMALCSGFKMKVMDRFPGEEMPK